MPESPAGSRCAARIARAGRAARGAWRASSAERPHLGAHLDAATPAAAVLDLEGERHVIARAYRFPEIDEHHMVGPGLERDRLAGGQRDRVDRVHAHDAA